MIPIVLFLRNDHYFSMLKRDEKHRQTHPSKINTLFQKAKSNSYKTFTDLSNNGKKNV